MSKFRRQMVRFSSLSLAAITFLLFVSATLPTQAKPQLDNGARNPKTEFIFVPHPIGPLVLTSGKGSIKAGKGTELTSQDSEAVFEVAIKGLEPNTSVRVTYTAAAVSGSAVAGVMVDGNRAARGPEISGTQPVTGTLTATLPDGEGTFSLSLTPSSKIRVISLKAEKLK